MNTYVPAPPSSEAARQKVIHSLRMQRVKLSKQLAGSEYTDNKALSQLVEVNAQIEGLRWAKEQGLDMLPEPSIEDIESRAYYWYWEEWRDDVDDE